MIYADRPLRPRKYYDLFHVETHGFGAKDGGHRECYHYNADKDDAAKLIADGKARPLTPPGVCMTKY